MEDLYIPKKLLRIFLVGLFIVALLLGVISGDMENTGKLIMDGTKPIAERIERKLLRVLERALDTQADSESDSGV